MAAPCISSDASATPRPRDAMPQACKLSFSSHRLLPMGSYARIADRKGVYELFGPVNKLYCARYDRAMVAFLACLKVCALVSARGSRSTVQSFVMDAKTFTLYTSSRYTAVLACRLQQLR